MKLDLKNIPALFAPVLSKIRQYGAFVVVLLVLGAFAFIIVRINYYATLEPSQAAIDEKVLHLQQTQINQEAIDKIEKLNDTNVDVKALFDEARDNPFHE